MNCPRCGARVMDGAQFCGACGLRLADAGGYTPPPSSSATGGGYAPGGWQATGGIHIDEDSRGSGRGYSYEILHQPSFALAVLRLEAEQSIQAESGAMVSMSGNVELQSQLKGGVMSTLR